ncbi:MAG: hypothetical protein M1838_003308 [Thelocarpon superellum]|nr:MAG: hypothetical protein M1838_003308 [Thelocarpon superellum]
MAFLLSFIRSQFFVKLPYPELDLTGQTLIVTGANTGLGLETARHFVRLNAKKVILGVRSVEKGGEACKSIEQSTGRAHVVEVWALDLSSYESVMSFAAKVQGLPRLDAVVENAGISVDKYQVLEDNESTITVNVVSTFLLALLMLPKLRESASRFNFVPRLTIVTSDMHQVASFPERHSENIFDAINNPAAPDMSGRYPLSKLLEIYIVRELGPRANDSPKKPPVAINTANPGFCYSDLMRDAEGLKGMFLWGLKALTARSTEAGSRNFVFASQLGMESNGRYFTDCAIEEPSKSVRTEDGKQTQAKVWAEISQKLEAIRPGILQNV